MHVDSSLKIQPDCCRTVMNLTCSEGGKCPCPICYVPKSEQADLTKIHKLHIVIESQEIYHQALAQKTKAARKELLKLVGLRMIKVSS